MNVQLNTPEGMYRAVLDGIKKENTSVLTPDRFNRLINNFALVDWMNEKAPKNDKDQGIIDDLRNLYSTEIADITSNSFELPGNYHRVQNVSIRNTNKDVDKQIEWEPTIRVRFDSISMMSKNPFRKASEDKIYYYQEGIKIVLYPNAFGCNKARLFYLKKPSPIIFEDGNKNSKLVISDLGLEQCREVVDIAIRIEIERVKEERYQTQLMEENIRNVKK